MNTSIYERAIANIGDKARLRSLMKRAMAGESLTLGFLGGSITQGCLSSVPETCYAYLVYEWFCHSFKAASFTYLNAGIGGTTSQFGTARADDDLLSYRPDFVIVEFSVNDEATDFFEETYESLIRKVLGAECRPAVLILNNVRYDDGVNAQEQHNRVGRAYGIPCISIRDSIYPEIEKGRLERSDITTDNLHPNDKGHAILSGAVTYYLDKLYDELKNESDAAEKECEALSSGSDVVPLTACSYMNAVRHQNYNETPVSSGFTADTVKQEDIRDIFRNGWTADSRGAFVRFEVLGSEIAIQYRKTIHKPSPIARAIIDGDEAHSVILDGNFDETWGDSLHIDTLMHHGENRLHTVEIRIEATHEDDVTPFYLVSVISA